MQNVPYEFHPSETGAGLLRPQRSNDWRHKSTTTGPLAQSYRPQEDAKSESPRPRYFRPEPFDLDQVCKNLIVNYLPQAFTDKHLFDLFVPFGPLHSVKIMREIKTGYSYGFGFVNFIRVEDAIVALQAMRGFQVGPNKRLKVSFARPPSDDIKDTNLYITNLPKTATEEDLFDMFGKFGTIVQRNLLYDKWTGLSRGTGFVRYAHRDQAAQAIYCMNGYIPKGAWEPIHVKLAQDHGKQKAYLTGFKDSIQRGGSASGRSSRARSSTCV